MSEQNAFEGWAKVEIMGHQSHIGFVTTVIVGATGMFRVDQPEIPATKRTLTSREYTTAAGFLPAGAVVEEPAIAGVSVLLGASSIYRIIPCTEEAAIEASKRGIIRPLKVVSMPAAMEQITAAAASPDNDDDDEGEWVDVEPVPAATEEKFYAPNL